VGIIILVAVLTVLLVGFIWWNFRGRVTEIPPAKPPASKGPEEQKKPEEQPLVTSLAGGLDIPWALDFLPDKSIVFTERPGRVRLIDSKGVLQPEPILTIAQVAHVGEGGLLGIVVHPNFRRNRFIYLYYTYRAAGGLANKVVRYEMTGGRLTEPKDMVTNIPGGSIHDGGRIKFGPDGFLYVTTGDSGESQLAQNRNSLAGKILRLTDEGAVPADNPFPSSPVYSFGHRNPQGLAWDDKGRLWATEHGQSATDEVNLIEPGKNYGWPAIRGNQTARGLQSPVIQSGSDTWAPSGTSFLDGSLFFTGLRGQSLFELKIGDGTEIELLRHLRGDFGRLRDVVVGPDGFLYVLTNNRDGRGFPTTDDDQILKVNPKKL
jgi:glucose/arabinose dehydrogenase